MKLRFSLVTAGVLSLALVTTQAVAGGVAVGIRIGAPVFPVYSAYRPYPVAVAAEPVAVPVYPAAPVTVVAPPVVVGAPVVAVAPLVGARYWGARYWGPRGVVVVH